MNPSLSVFDAPETLPVKIESVLMQQREITLLRFDRLHPEYGGNKWFKLKYNLKRALDEKRITLISFGGAYSNHLYSLAAACRDFKLKSVGVVRGEEHYAKNESLDFCRSCGMILHYLSKEAYANRFSEEYQQYLHNLYPDALIIPDGGENNDGVKGASEMSFYVPDDVQHLFVSCGTFTTVSGILSTLKKDVTLWAVPALKAESWARPTISRILHSYGFNDLGTLTRCNILYDYHFGGFAKTNNELINFQRLLIEQNGLWVDHVYVAKMFYALNDLVKKERINSKEKVAVVMCGRPTYFT